MQTRLLVKAETQLIHHSVGLAYAMSAIGHHVSSEGEKLTHQTTRKQCNTMHKRITDVWRPEIQNLPSGKMSIGSLFSSSMCSFNLEQKIHLTAPSATERKVELNIYFLIFMYYYSVESADHKDKTKPGHKILSQTRLVIAMSKFLKRYSNPKCRASAYL